MRRLFLLAGFILFTTTLLAQKNKLQTGADQVDDVVRALQGKRVGLVVNQTSLVRSTHLADTLKSRGVNLVKIFGPEHGFRGNAADGEHIKDGLDPQTGLPVVSLYGGNRKPTPEQLSDLDIVVFDIQDVGTRFYTYISTLHMVMEAASQQGKKVLVLDRPNPHGSYVDGPVLFDQSLKSFVGMHPIPIVHGCTIGEYAGMINGEGWLDKGIKCEVEVIKMKNWAHQDAYVLPVRPSPNLPNNQAILLYPSICLFEGTAISLGRGTEMPFQVLGSPVLKNMHFEFTPVTIEGVAKNPPLEGQLCHGLDLRKISVPRRIDLHYLLEMYAVYPEKDKFFIAYFDKLAGTKELKEQIKQGMTEEQIRATWKKDLDAYKAKRKKYLLYK